MKTSNQLFLVTQHRFTGKWYGVIHYSDGNQSPIYGPFLSNEHAMKSLQQIQSDRPPNGLPDEVCEEAM